MPFTGETEPVLEQYGQILGFLLVFGMNLYPQAEHSYFTMPLLSRIKDKKFAEL